MNTVKVNVGGGYDIKTGRGLLGSCGEEIAAIADGAERAVIITDSSVEKLFLRECEASIGKFFGVSSFVFPAGERSKNIGTISDMLEFMAESKMTRRDIVIALGGGVAGDMAGFAAGCYMRGVRFVQLPTTLLAAVDSSVGGKTAVDLRAGKNMAGLFHQPSLVLCSTDCLDTLPEEELLCGAAEALKTGVLCGGRLFDIFERGSFRDCLDEVITMCVRYKAGVVERDERELGERKLLNLGHTIGHAAELLSGYSLKHGLAVSAGLAIIARASARLGWCSEETARRIVDALRGNGLPVSSEHSASELAKAAMSDKKRSGAKITIAVPSEIGACTLKTIAADELESIISKGLE